MKRKTKIQANTYHQKIKSKSFEICKYIVTSFTNTSLHKHDFYEICLLTKGCVEYRIETNVYRIKETNLLIIPPDVFHKQIEVDDESYEKIVLKINKEYLFSLIDNEELLNCFKNNIYVLESNIQYDEIVNILEHLIKGIDDDQEIKKTYNKSLLLMLLVIINRLSKSQINKKQLEKSNSLISEVLAYINDNYAQDINIETIAKQFFLNKYYLSHLFVQETGTTLYNYIIKRRLVKARELLLCGCSPKDACKRAGFGDYNNFYRTYKKEYTVTPKQDYAKAKLMSK